MNKSKHETLKRAKHAKHAFLTALKQPSKLQPNVVQALLRENQNSQFGRKHGFETISSLDEYQKVIPIHQPEEFSTWMDRAAAGEKQVLTDADPVVFFTSSGSTGKHKRIPVTTPFVKHCYLPFVFTAFGNFFDYYPDSILNNESTINFKWDHSAGTGTTDSGKPHIGASQVDWEKTFGATAAAEPGTSEIWSNPPPELTQHMDRLYYRVRLSAGFTIQTLIGINPSLIAVLPHLINTWADRLITEVRDGTVLGEKSMPPRPELAAKLAMLRDHCGRLLPAHLWPALKVIFCWTTGIARLYLPDILRYYGSNVELMPAPVAASEGPIGVPIDHNPTAGALALPWVLLEFIEADRLILPDSPTLMYDALKTGGEYHVVLSHIGGLYRYALGDIIKVVDKYNGEIPLVEYVGRNHNKESAQNILSESTIVDAISQATQRSGVTCVNCSYRTGYSNDITHYEFALEVTGQWLENDKNNICKVLDEALINTNHQYRSNRESGKLGHATINIVPTNTFYNDWCQRVNSGIRPAQAKDRLYETNHTRWDNLMNTPAYNPVSKTALLTAAIRAQETQRTDRLYTDQFATQLAGAEGIGILQAYKASRDGNSPSLNVGDFNAIRTRYFDETIQALVTNHQITQIILVGAGLDTRAFRISWPENTTIYEIDNETILDHKNAILSDQKPLCDNRYTLSADIRQDWLTTLNNTGYNRNAASVWVLEGLLYYLTETDAQSLLQDIKSVSCTGSHVLLDLVNRETLSNPLTKPFLDYLAELGAPYVFATDSPQAFLSKCGIHNVSVKEPGETGVHFDRWPSEPLPAHMQGIPRAYLAVAEI